VETVALSNNGVEREELDQDQWMAELRSLLNQEAAAGGVFVKIVAGSCHVALQVRNVEVGSPHNPDVVLRTKELHPDSTHSALLIEFPLSQGVRYRKMTGVADAVVLTAEHWPDRESPQTVTIHVSNRKGFLAYEEHGEGSAPLVQ
jgi:hypothetical protein